MLTGVTHLGLDVRSLDRARAFYEERLGLVPVDPPEDASTATATVAYRVGETTLSLRQPGSTPRGGVHTHYAFTTTPAEYDRWLDRLADLDPVERSFGSYRSLYVDDPDGHCVEIGDRDTDRNDADSDAAPSSDDDSEAHSAQQAPSLTGIFEIVFEVRDLERSERLYRRLGFEVVDRGDERPRVRLRGPFDLELWEPQLGIADGRGGVHVDLGVTTPDPATAVAAVANDVAAVEPVADGYRIRDPDGHHVTFRTD